MMRLHTHQSTDRLLIEVEGQLTAANAPELEQCWLTAHAGSVQLDLSKVFSVDGSGRRLLRSMHNCGVTFIGARLAIRDVLEEITKPG